MANRPKSPTKVTGSHKLRTPWLNNVLKSVGIATSGALKNIAPNISEVTRTTANIAVTSRDLAMSMGRNKAGLDRVTTQLNNNKFVKAAHTAMHNVWSDIQSGNLAGDSSRMMDAIKGSSESGDGLTFGEEDLSGANINVNYNGGSEEMLSAITSLSEQNKQIALANVKMQEASINAFTAVSAAQINQMGQVGDELISHITNVENSLAAMVEFNNSTLAKYIESSTAYMESMGRHIEAMDEKEDIRRQIFNNGKFDAAGYKSYIKKSAKEALKNTALGQLSGMLDDDMLDMLAANPLGMLSVAAVEHAMPVAMKRTIQMAEDSMNAVAPIFIDRMKDLAEDQSNGVAGIIKRFIGQTLGVDLEADKKNSLSLKIPEGATPFDSETKVAITQIITGELQEQTSLLKQIVYGGVGKGNKGLKGAAERRRYFDYESGRYITKDSVDKGIAEDIVNAISSGFSKTEFGRSMQKFVSTQTNEKAQEEASRLLQQFYVAIERNSKDELTQEKLIEYIDKLNASNNAKRGLRTHVRNLAASNPRGFETVRGGRVSARVAAESAARSVEKGYARNNLIHSAFNTEDADFRELLDQIYFADKAKGRLRFSKKKDLVSEYDDLNNPIANGIRGFADRVSTSLEELVKGNTKAAADAMFGGIADKALEFTNKATESITGSSSEGKGFAGLWKNYIDDLKIGFSTIFFGAKAGAKSAGLDIKDSEIQRQLQDRGVDLNNGGVFGAISDFFAKGFQGWSKALFGTDEEEQEKTKQELLQRAKEALPSAAKGAGIGAATGLAAGSSILGALIGGPVGGALLGTVGGFISKSQTFQNWLFGEDVDPEHPEKGKIGGFISRRTQEFFKEHKNELFGSTAIGTVLGTLTGGGLLGTIVGGPIAGAALGLGAGIIKHNGTFNQFLFGDEDHDSFFTGIAKAFTSHAKIRGGDIDDEAASMGMIGAAGGALSAALIGKMGILGASLTPLGPIGGAVLGLGAGIAAQGKTLKEFLWGEKDGLDLGNGKRRDKAGFFGRVLNNLQANLLGPVSSKFADIMDDISLRVKYDVLTPIQIIGEGIAGKAGDITGFLVNSASQVFNSVGGAISDGFKDAFPDIGTNLSKITTTALGTVSTIAKTAVSAPATALNIIFSKPAELITKTINVVGSAALDGVGTIVRYTTSTIAGFFGTTFKMVKGVIGMVRNGIDRFAEVTGIGKLISGVKTSVGDKIRGIQNWLDSRDYNRGDRSAGAKWRKSRAERREAFAFAKDRKRKRKRSLQNAKVVNRLTGGQFGDDSDAARAFLWQQKLTAQDDAFARDQSAALQNEFLRLQEAGELPEDMLFDDFVNEYQDNLSDPTKAGTITGASGDLITLKSVLGREDWNKKHHALADTEEAKKKYLTSLGIKGQSKNEIEGEVSIVGKSDTMVKSMKHSEFLDVPSRTFKAILELKDIMSGSTKDKDKKDKDKKDKDTDEKENAVDKFNDAIRQYTDDIEAERGGNGRRAAARHSRLMRNNVAGGGRGILGSILGIGGSLLGGAVGGIGRILGSIFSAGSKSASRAGNRAGSALRDYLFGDSGIVTEGIDNNLRYATARDAAVDDAEDDARRGGSKRMRNASDQEGVVFSEKEAAEARARQLEAVDRAETAEEVRAKKEEEKKRKEPITFSERMLARLAEDQELQNEALGIKSTGITAGLLAAMPLIAQAFPKLLEHVGALPKILGDGVSFVIKELPQYIDDVKTVLTTIKGGVESIQDTFDKTVGPFLKRFGNASDAEGDRPELATKRLPKKLEQLGYHTGMYTAKRGATVGAKALGKAAGQTLAKDAAKKGSIRALEKEGVKKLEGVVGKKTAKQLVQSASSSTLKAGSKATMEAVEELSESAIKAFNERLEVMLMNKLGKEAAEKVLEKIPEEVSEKGVKALIKAAMKSTKEVAEMVTKRMTTAAIEGAADVFTLGLLHIISAVGGAVNAAFAASKLFRVRKSDVDATMELITVIIGAVLGGMLEFGQAVMILFDIIYIVFDKDVLHMLAVAIYETINRDDQDKINKFRQNMEALNSEWLNKVRNPELEKELATKKKYGLVGKNVTLQDYVKGVNAGKYSTDVETEDEWLDRTGGSLWDRAIGTLRLGQRNGERFKKYTVAYAQQQGVDANKVLSAGPYAQTPSDVNMSVANSSAYIIGGHGRARSLGRRIAGTGKDGISLASNVAKWNVKIDSDDPAGTMVRQLGGLGELLSNIATMTSKEIQLLQMIATDDDTLSTQTQSLKAMTTTAYRPGVSRLRSTISKAMKRKFGAFGVGGRGIGGTYFDQGDNRWGGLSISPDETMADSGCGPTAAAMAIDDARGFGGRGNGLVSPVDIAASENQYYDDRVGFTYGGMEQTLADYGTNFRSKYTPSISDLNQEIDKNNSVVIAGSPISNILSGGRIPDNHYVVASKGKKSDTVNIRDPYGAEWSGEMPRSGLSGVDAMWSVSRSGGRGKKKKNKNSKKEDIALSMVPGMSNEDSEKLKEDNGKAMKEVKKEQKKEEEKLTQWIECVKAVKSIMSGAGYSQGHFSDITVNGVPVHMRNDCSGFVSGCLQAFGVFPHGKNLTSSGFTNQGNGDMINTGFTPMSWPGWEALVPGDIISKDGHVEIFAGIEGGAHKVWNRGSDTSCHNPGVTNSAKSSYTTIWRVGSAGSYTGTGATSADGTSSGGSTTPEKTLGNLFTYIINSVGKVANNTLMGNWDDKDFSWETIMGSSSSGSSESGESAGGSYGSGAGAASIKDSDNARKIWKFLTGSLGYSKEGAAAVMGNLFQESGYQPANVQNGTSADKAMGGDSGYTSAVDSGSYTRDQFISDSAGYGLAQWTSGGRKAGLYDLAKSRGDSIGSLDTQLDFLAQEMSQPAYNDLRAALTAEGGDIGDLTIKFLDKFERAGTRVPETRISNAQAAYDTFHDLIITDDDAKKDKKKRNKKKKDKGMETLEQSSIAGVSADELTGGKGRGVTRFVPGSDITITSNRRPVVKRKYSREDIAKSFIPGGMDTTMKYSRRDIANAFIPGGPSEIHGTVSDSMANTVAQASAATQASHSTSSGSGSFGSSSTTSGGAAASGGLVDPAQMEQIIGYLAAIATSTAESSSKLSDITKINGIYLKNNTAKEVKRGKDKHTAKADESRLIFDERTVKNAKKIAKGKF